MAEFRAGRTLIVRDVAGDPRLDPTEREATKALFELVKHQPGYG